MDKDMPDGIEWPMFKSGGPVGIGDRFTDRSGIGRTVAFISFYDSDFSIRAEDGTIHFYKYGEPLGPAPVIAADGKPLEVGQTVYGIEDGAEYKVCDFDEGDPIVEYWSGGICVHGCASPTRLTHTRPVTIDTWERIEDDAGCTATKYNERRGTTFTTKQQVARDLVRRCKELSRKENNNE